MNSLPGTGVMRRQSRSAGSSAASSSRISACSGSVSWNSSTKMCVNRAWNARRTLACADQQIARAQQQIDEVERAGALLEALVAHDHLAQLDVEQRGEVAVRGALKLVERRHRRFVGRPDRRRGAPGPYARSRPAAGAPQVLVLREVDDARFPAVEIGGIEALGGQHVVAQLADRAGIEIQRIARRRRRVAQPRQLVNARERPRRAPRRDRTDRAARRRRSRATRPARGPRGGAARPDRRRCRGRRATTRCAAARAGRLRAAARAARAASRETRR